MGWMGTMKAGISKFVIFNGRRAFSIFINICLLSFLQASSIITEISRKAKPDILKLETHSYITESQYKTVMKRQIEYFENLKKDKQKLP